PWLHWLFLAILAIAAREAARHRREPFGCGIVAKEFLLILERDCRPMSHCQSLDDVRLRESARDFFARPLSPQVPSCLLLDPFFHLVQRCSWKVLNRWRVACARAWLCLRGQSYVRFEPYGAWEGPRHSRKLDNLC